MGVVKQAEIERQELACLRCDEESDKQVDCSLCAETFNLCAACEDFWGEEHPESDCSYQRALDHE